MNITRQLQPPAHQRQPQQHAPLSHLSTDFHWASVWDKCSGANPVSLTQEMGNWILGCMTHLKAEGKLVKTWDPGTLVPRLGDFQEGKDERNLNCIHSWVALRCLQAPELKFFPIAPQVWFWFYQQTCLHVGTGKQYSRLLLLGSRHSGRAPGIVTLGGSHAHGDWLTPNSDPQSSHSSFTQDRPLADWVTWTYIHSKKHSLLSLLAT